MVSKHLTFSILAILIAGVIFISGCTSEQTQPAGASGCPSPYDGTYSGLVSGSGEITKYPDNGQPVVSPYIITYNLEVTFECEKNDPIELCYNSEKPDQMCRWHYVTHAKVSDPFFDCTNGCTPTINSYLSAPMDTERGGDLLVDFPNGASLSINPLLIDSDAKTIRADQSDHEELIGSSNLGSNLGQEYSDMAQVLFKCPDCIADEQGITMTLDKIS